MIFFAIGFVGITLLTIVIQLLSSMKIVGGNELGIVSGKGSDKGFRSLSGGRIFILPIINKFAKLDLTPYTIEVVVDSAIAVGIVPLNVKATVSFAIAGNVAGRMRAVTRILSYANNAQELRRVASDIIEGHLRDSIASMSPEQVMMDKDALVARMINVCKMDLENIGLEITTMNIADVDDHRLEGVDEPDLYIALLKRVQTANADTKARIAQAESKAASAEEQQQRRAEVQVRNLENKYEDLVSETKVRLKTEEQRQIVGVEQERRQAAAEVAGMKKQIAATKEAISMLQKRYEAQMIIPAHAEKERMVLEAQSKAIRMKAKAEAEIEQLQETLKIIQEEKQTGIDTFILENFESLIAPFAETMEFFPVDRLSIISGAEGKHEPISAIHPHAVDEQKNDFLKKMLADSLSTAGAAISVPAPEVTGTAPHAE